MSLTISSKSLDARRDPWRIASIVFWSVAQIRLSLDTVVSRVNLSKILSTRSFAAIFRLHQACQLTAKIRSEDIRLENFTQEIDNR